MKQQRLKAEDRCDAIRKAMSEVFAEKGFEGTTTRDLAKAAGVSEALLYRHYPSKQAMYAAMTQGCLDQQGEEEFKTILAMESSASTLVFLTHFMMKRMIVEAQKNSFDVLIVRSLLEDGELERTLMKARGGAWHKKVRESFEAARKAGEAVDLFPIDELTGWLCKAVGFGLGLLLMPKTPVFETKLSRAEIAERAVLFILLGMGLKPEVIKKHYNAKGLSLLAGV